jgi:hypothetical protein
MKMRNLSMAMVAVLLGTVSACSSSNKGADGGEDGAAGTSGDAAAATDGPHLFALTSGDSCFDIVAVATDTSDGCMDGVDALAGTAALPFNYTYTNSTATVTVGTEGSLGAGPITNNMGTLTRGPDAVTDPTHPGCSWTQQDTSMITLTADNTFTLAVTEVQTAITAPCVPAFPTGTCTSTWKWMMKKSTTKTPPTCQ